MTPVAALRHGTSVRHWVRRDQLRATLGWQNACGYPSIRPLGASERTALVATLESDFVPMYPPRKPNTRRHGYSLLELVAAAALMAFALVPALAILRDGMRWSRDIDTRELLLTLAVSKVEEQTSLVAAAWTPTTLEGDFSADGHANVRYSVVRSDQSSDGGIPDRLMNITVTTYDDMDGNDALGAGEPSLLLTTKIGKFATYEAQAGS